MNIKQIDNHSQVNNIATSPLQSTVLHRDLILLDWTTRVNKSTYIHQWKISINKIIIKLTILFYITILWGTISFPSLYQNKEQLSLKLKVYTFEYTNREKDSKRDKYSSGAVEGLEARFVPFVLGWLVKSSTWWSSLQQAAMGEIYIKMSFYFFIFIYIYIYILGGVLNLLI